MSIHDREFALILNQTVKIGRRSSFTTTSMGQRRQTGESTIVASLSVYFDFNPKGYVWQGPGQFMRVDYFMFAKYDADVQTGDLVYPLTGLVGLTLGRVMGVTPIMDFDGATHHIEALIEKTG